MSSFVQRLAAAWHRNNSLLCIGLDPEPQRLPTQLSASPSGIYDFNVAIIDATADLVCAYKPQFAHYAALRAETQLEQTIQYIHQRYPDVPVILDAKRGDVGHTAERYAAEAFERYQADAVTVNPYLGGDSLEPFLRHADKGVIVLCRTSNAGAGDFQDLQTQSQPLYLQVAHQAVQHWNSRGNCALVVGATYPQQLAQVRALVGDMPLLVPGVGAQGGDVQQVVQQGQTAAGTGLMISASRSIIYAAGGAQFAKAAREAAATLREQINQHRQVQK
jgi:orotidine-5'-phosphate decarboxylase